MQDAYWDHLDQLDAASDRVALRDKIAVILGSFGLDQFTYHELRPLDDPTTSYFISNYKSSWINHYIEQKCRYIDPVILKARIMNQPFRWPSRSGSGALTSGQNLFFNEAGEFGIRRGITVPIHGPGSFLSLLTAAADMPANDVDDVLSRHRHELCMLASTAHAVAERLRDRDAPNVRLTGRQQECLLWTARGKTAWEVGEILSISEETVVFHLKAACRKFGVYGKHLAVVKAIMFGLISP